MFRLSRFMEALRDAGPVPPARKAAGPVVIWNLIRRCNLTCMHCYSISADVDFPGELQTDEVYAVMDDLRAFKVRALILSGGEPLLRKDLFEIAARGKALGFYLGLSTNGTLIDDALARRIATTGFDYVGISLDGLGATHDRFRRKAGAFELQAPLVAPARRDELEAIRAWMLRTGTGDRGEMGALGEDSEWWEALTTTPDTRLGPRCPHFESCHVTQARRAAEKADIIVGEEVPLRVVDYSSAGGAAGSQPRSTVQFRETGIRLTVTPHVTNNRQILMSLKTERSNVKPLAAADLGFSIDKQATENQLLVADGETAVIGGLTVTSVTRTRSGVPLLSALPIVGGLFSFTSNSENRKDLIILVTPRILDDASDVPAE